MRIYFLASLFWVSCTVGQQQHLKFRENSLNKIVQSYVAAIAANKDSTFRIMINSRRSHDTVTVSLANADPDLSMTKFYGCYTFRNYQVCLTGDSSVFEFFEVTDMEAPPEDIVRRNKLFRESDKLTMPISEPRIWLFYFNKGKLVGFFPHDQIKAICAECKIQ